MFRGKFILSELCLLQSLIRCVVFWGLFVFLWKNNICGFISSLLTAFCIYFGAGGWKFVLFIYEAVLHDVNFVYQRVLTSISCQIKLLPFTKKTLSTESPIFVSANGNSHVANLASFSEKTNLRNSCRPFKDIPGPLSLPFIGTTWQHFFGAYYNLQDLHQANIDKFHRYGPVVKEEFQWRRPLVHLYDPDDIETMFKEQGNKPVRPINEFVKHYRLTKPDKYESPGLSNLVGEEWYQMRKTLAPVLLRLNSTGTLMPAMNRICDDFTQLIRYERHPVNLKVENVQKLLYRLALESIYLMCLEERLGCLECELQPGTLAYTLISSVKLLFEAFQELYFGLPLWKYFTTKSYKKLGDAESTMYEAASNRVDEAMENLRNEVEDEALDDRVPGILRKLLRTKNLSDKEVKATVIDFLSGGIFTVANAFSFLLYHLSCNPAVQEKLYSHLQEIAPDGEITAERFSKLNYLKACVKESFRLTPTIPGIARVLPIDIVASGYHIPAGTPVFSNFMVACKRPDIFPNPEEYRPDRWLGEEGKLIHSFTQMPFGFGSRMCVGRRFAEMEMYIGLAKLIHNFKLKSTGQQISCKQDFIVVPSGPVSLIFEDR